MKIQIRVTDDKNQTYDGMMELTKSAKQVMPKKIQIIVKGPTDAIRELYFQNYFENSRTLHDVEQKIKSKKYNFDLPAITLALQRAKYLKQNGQRGRYSYIQKTPPN